MVASGRRAYWSVLVPKRSADQPWTAEHADLASSLQAILEEVLLNIMYDVPSRDDVAQVIINADVVKESVLPTLVPRDKFAKRERREKSA